MTTPNQPLAEIIAVGDEMTGGQRLDTNTQWLASQLNDLGIEVAYHSTVGDDLQRQTDVIRTAIERANIVLMTGGLGPTKDDLTRQAIADAAGVELVSDPSALAHIESIFARYNRVMSPANQQQALFPVGGQTIHNEEGTAPGVDFDTGNCRIFAMPGVPYEMKQMFETYVANAVRSSTGTQQIIRHHVLRCFGVGESEAESRMPDLIERDRQPRVGITASMAVISFRITATGRSESDCQSQIDATSNYIRSILGNVVFGENEDTLSHVTAELLANQHSTVSFVDFQFGGAAARLLRAGVSDHLPGTTLRQSLSIDDRNPDEWNSGNHGDSEISTAATQVREKSGSDIGVAVGRLLKENEDAAGGTFPVAISFAKANRIVEKTFHYGGHSSMRETRSANQVVNFLRLQLLELQRSG